MELNEVIEILTAACENDTYTFEHMYNTAQIKTALAKAVIELKKVKEEQVKPCSSYFQVSPEEQLKIDIGNLSQEFRELEQRMTTFITAEVKERTNIYSRIAELEKKVNKINGD